MFENLKQLICLFGTQITPLCKSDKLEKRESSIHSSYIGQLVMPMCMGMLVDIAAWSENPKNAK